VPLSDLQIQALARDAVQRAAAGDFAGAEPLLAQMAEARPNSGQVLNLLGQARLKLGRSGPGFGTELPAEERVYTEALTGETVYTYHARLDHLPDDTFFVEIAGPGFINLAPKPAAAPWALWHSSVWTLKSLVTLLCLSFIVSLPRAEKV
jgi:hypothetical protein